MDFNMENLEDNNEKYIEDPNYRSLTSDDIKWYLEQKDKTGNKELKNVKHIIIEENQNTNAMYQELILVNQYEKKKEPEIAKAMALQDTVVGELLDQMANSLRDAKQQKKENFCEKLLISNKEGMHTYAFIYGIYNNKPFVITFAQNDLDVLTQVMATSKDMLLKKNDIEYGAINQCFGKNILCISSVHDKKSCGTIALKIMKYLKYENIQKILDSNAIYQDEIGNKHILSKALPRKLVQYIQSCESIHYHDKHYDDNKIDRGKQPGTVYNKIKSKNRIKLKGSKEINTTAEVKQKQIINRMTATPAQRKAGGKGISI